MGAVSAGAHDRSTADLEAWARLYRHASNLYLKQID